MFSSCAITYVLCLCLLDRFLRGNFSRKFWGRRGQTFLGEKKRFLGRLLCIRKTYTKMDPTRFFFRDQKHERRPSYAYGFGLLYFRQTRTGLPMRARYSNEIAEWKWPPTFQNKRVRYARKSRRAGPLQ